MKNLRFFFCFLALLFSSEIVLDAAIPEGHVVALPPPELPDSANLIPGIRALRKVQLGRARPLLDAPAGKHGWVGAT